MRHGILLEMAAGGSWSDEFREKILWSAREAVPVAAPQANPLNHLMTVFGGRQ